MEEITVKSKLNEIESLKKYRGLLLYRSEVNEKPSETYSLEGLQQGISAWNAESALAGLKRLQELSAKQQVMYPVYTDEECQDDEQKKNVKVMHFPPEEDKKAPFLFVIAGGAYCSVCSAVESIPTAVHFNKLGYHVFILNYRVGTSKVLPKPLDDLAAAYKFVVNKKEEFGLTTEEYGVCGFSAGANLTNLWGTKERGYAHYGLPKPKVLFPIYTFVSVPGPSLESERLIWNIMCGKDASQEEIEKYKVSNMLDTEYPPCFIVHCKDDSTVPYENSVYLYDRLKEYRIRTQLKLGEKGEHGFGDGRGTDVEGWPEEAIKFLESL